MAKTNEKPNARTFGKLCITTTVQPCGAPFIDKGWTREDITPFREWKVIVILLTPWRRNRWKEHLKQKALVLGWQK